MLTCKGCNKQANILIPSPKALQNMDGTGEIITELCGSCLGNLLRTMRENGQIDNSKELTKINKVQTLITKATSLGIEVPTDGPISVDRLEKLIAENQ